MKNSDGLSIDIIPLSHIWKNPFSIPPNLFLELTNTLSSSSLSSSIIRTVSTRCSNALNPASSSFLVICPTIITALCLFSFLATFSKAFAHSIVCVGDPALAGIAFSIVNVWILSIITKSGSISSIASNTLSRLVSWSTHIFSFILSSILSALFFIWLSLSSPEAYITLSPRLDTSFEIWSNKVDFPAPGLAVIIDIESFTIPPPITLSNSFIPVIILSLLFDTTSFNFFNGFLVASLTFAALVFLSATTTSSKVFQQLHVGHFPSHFMLSNPQFEHLYTVFFFIKCLLRKFISKS